MTAIAIPLQANAACLSGVNLAGAEFGQGRGTYGKDYAYPSDETITYFADKGFNAARLPFKWERLQPRLNRNFDKAERKRLSDTVKALRKAGMTVILDPHNYAYYGDQQIGSAAVPDSAFADFWSRLAVDYKQDAGVQFGLMNEPHDVPATQWLASANAAIAAIRETGATNLVLVPGTIWSGAHSWEEERDGGANGTVMLGIQDPADNNAYEVHQYLDGDFSGKASTCERADDAVKALERFTDWLKRNGKRGFLGEFGGSAEPACLDGLARMTALVHRENAVWTGWTYWAAGDWWPASEPLNIQPTADGDRPQLAALMSGGALPAKPGTCPSLP
ncbi:glycoside hydrolase family 5 protein [Shinella sp. H4-D48]|uniref:Glycoside hydrolase family 5 protein n=1 Tax=Shinella sedimenti TaxID=2919913 RepID=A0ABT0CKU5_9HYPH|nr:MULTISPECIES: glycoside hydrolase family 5 protein [Shinella]MCJ8149215.1 glycoside hydrolase family 5 protein [Shinella sedimenti]UNK37864.1 glycoside hydrolase family 5 protein [Shinella sp. H4-D48]